MECFKQESYRTVCGKKIWIHEHIGNIISDLVINGRSVNSMNESELGKYNKKLEKIQNMVNEL
jgi:hypothetical protein